MIQYLSITPFQAVPLSREEMISEVTMDLEKGAAALDTNSMEL
jgi:hypothetical protein